MGSSKPHYGYGQFDVDGEKTDLVGNMSHPFNQQHVFEAYVRTGYWAAYSRFGARIHFRRHSSLRPYVQNLRHRGGPVDIETAYSNSWETAINYEGSLGGGPDGIAGSSLTNRSDSFGFGRRDFGRNYQLGNYSAAIGSFVIDVDFDTGGSHLPATANALVGRWGREALSEVDLPRTTIGNVFRHPYNRGAWFNETLIVALSQGQIEITGAYNPPESRLMHAGFQVYYAKNGGTGTVVGAVKTTGETFPGGTSAARFRDTTFAGFLIGDVGKYIAVHGRGIYLITNFVDASNVDVDAVTVNEPFTNVTGLTWTLRTGPIAEYFFRRRPYFKLHSWTNYVDIAQAMLGFAGVDEILQPDKTEWNQIPQRVVYDGNGHWWWTTPLRAAGRQAQYGLMRHLHHSPQPWQAPLLDGSLTGFSNWAEFYADIIVDKNKKLWVSGSATTTTKNCLARVNPAPGGNAAAPVVEALWKKQVNAADPNGLTTNDVLALCDDRSGVYSGGPSTHRIWAIGGNNAGAVGGLSYSDDEGVTWKRVHALSAATGTVTATNGGTAVLGVGTLFTTEFAVGDWIRFGSDTRSYPITVITDALNMTLGTAYLGVTGGGKSLQKGALAANEAVCLTGYGFSNDTSSFCSGQHNIDWDTVGNVYWISQGARVCRWSEADGACVSFDQGSIAAVGPLPAINTGMPLSFLKVVRVPDVAGAGVHPFHNEVWLGTAYNGAEEGGWIRVRGDVPWTATPTGANFTRYHDNYTITTNFPSIVRVPNDNANSYQPRNTSIAVEPVTGNICLISSYGSAAGGGWHWLRMTGSEPGLEYWRATQNHAYQRLRGSGTAEPWNRVAYDEEGMGIGCVVSAQPSNTFQTLAASPMAFTASVWTDRRWNGSAWVPAMVAGNIHFDLNFRGGGNARTANAVLGAGLRRVHEWPEALEDDMYIAFTQAGGAVAQTDEFLADEGSTFVCAMGALKDNTQTANVYYAFYVQPTVQRLCDEAVKTVKNINTVDGGCDGGYTSSTSGSLTFTPPFMRGIADGFKHPVGYGQALGFGGMNSQAVNSGAANHATAVLRIADELELDADGFWTGGTDLFNTTGGHAFVPGDVGKSIFIEGANGATVDADNGQAVILARISASQVQVDKVFATTRVAAAGRRWKLRDVPAVSFVEMGMYATQSGYHNNIFTHTLWSSKDHGLNWSQVKYSNGGHTAGNAGLPAGGVLDQSPGTMATSHNGFKENPFNGNGDGAASVGASMIFDLRDLPENVRRRQYWRMRMFEPSGVYQNPTFFSGMFLYDANFKMIGRPATSKIDDADDDLFGAVQMDKWQDVRKTGVGAAPADDGNADGLTNVVNVTGPLYDATGLNDAELGATTITDYDTLFEQVTLLLTMNGANNSTGFTDLSNANNVMTAVGNAKVSTAQYKYGGASLLLDGASDWVHTPNVTPANFGTGDFCIEAWVRLNAMPTSDSWPGAYNNFMVILAQGDASSAAGVGFMVGQTNLHFQSNDSFLVAGAHGMVINTWYHVAVSRQGNTFRLFVDGVQVGTGSTAAAMGVGSQGIWIGAETGQGAYFNGYIDDLRVTKGAARYTSAFTPPVAELSSFSLSPAGVFKSVSPMFTRLSVGKFIRIAGAANAANNGWALITKYLNSTQVQTSKNFVAENNTFAWVLVSFGPGDELRIDSAVVAPTRGQALDNVFFTVTDVPTTSQILVQQTDVPHPIAAAAWDVGRDFAIDNGHPSSNVDWDRANRSSYSRLFGSLAFGYDLEFALVQVSTVGATTPADDDGDGVTNVIVVGEALTTNDGPAAGDYIEIVHPNYGRRMFEIAAITGSDPNKNLRVTYDELTPSLTGVSWRIYRRRNLQHQPRRMTVVGNGGPVT